MGDDERLRVTGFGSPATEALREMVADAKAGDPLAPVDVVVPSGVAGVTVRRELADPGLINVRFSSLPQLAGRLAARHLAIHGITPLTATARGLAVRAAVSASVGDLAERARSSTGTIDLIEGLIVELDDAEAFVLGRLDPLESPTAAGAGPQIASIYRAYRHLVRGTATAPELVDRAATAVDSGTAPETTVVLFAPRRLFAAERRLLTALASRGRLRCVQPVTGDSDGGGEEQELRSFLGDLLGSGASAPDMPLPALELELAPDAEEEVRVAVRRILTHLAEHDVRPERIAVAHRSSEPYPRLLDEQLTVAGLPFHVAGGRTLAQSVAGNAVLHLLELHHLEYARTEVLDWLTDAPILTTDGRDVPTARWDRLSRDAGVSRGGEQWQQRLDTHARFVDSRREELTGDSSLTETDRDARAGQYSDEIADTHALAAFVADVVAACDDLAAASTWRAVSERLLHWTQRFLGDAQQADRWLADTAAPRWVDVERQAYDDVLAAIEALAALDDTGRPPASYTDVCQAMSAELQASLPSGTTLGRGVTVGNIRDVAGADLDLLIVLGMTETAFPARLREHPILRDDARVAVGGLRTVADRRRAERRDFLAAVHSARAVVLSCPRADTRAQREAHPSPWFMAYAARLAGRELLTVADLVHAPAGQWSWLTRHDSFVAAFTATVPGSEIGPTERDLRLALDRHGEVLAAVDPRYARGRDAVQARLAGEFGPWTGAIGPLGDVARAQVDARLSASSLQQYAECPTRFWFDKVLRVRELDDPGDLETIDVMERGTLVHRVLERLFGTTLPRDGVPGRDPDEAWTTEEITRAREIFDEEADRVEARGITGRPMLWQAQKARLRRQIARILSVDSRLRRQRRSTPIAAEDDFGRHGQAHLVLPLSRGVVALAGSVDRIDRAEDGRLYVTDYKTGAGRGYDAIPRLGTRPGRGSDIIDRGRKIQLVLYGLAARLRHGRPDTKVEGYYWFVEQGELHRGGVVDEAAEGRLLGALDTVVGGIYDGVFPANPGEEETFFGGWKHCSYCPYNRICPVSRGEQWQRLREHPDVAAYTALADPDPVTDPEVDPGAAR